MGLPQLHFAAYAAVVPVHAYVFAVCGRGFAQARIVQGAVAHGETVVEVSPVGRQRLRPGSIIIRNEELGISNYYFDTTLSS